MSLCLLFASSFAFPAIMATATTVACGATITKSTTLTHDLGSSTSPCKSDGIDIGASSITLNCNGHTLWGAGDGVSISGFNHVTVKNCITRGFEWGFDLSGITANTFTNDKAFNSRYTGFDLYDSSVNTFTKDVANGTMTGYGFYLQGASNNRFAHNISEKNVEGGWYVDSSSTGNSLISNSAKDNSGYGFEDLSSGTGTAGTANTYSMNTCMGNGGRSSNPAGLC
jgi:parallel beta-helix repeat protein